LQKTIQKDVMLEGVGLHTGHSVKMILKPASPNTGVIFQRVDLPEKPFVKADISSVLFLKNSPRRSTISFGDVQVQTIEHLMASLSGLGIDNLLVEINNDEVPGLDGSALGFLQAIRKAGLKEQGVPRRTFKVTTPLVVQDEDSTLLILPSQDFRISYTLSYDNPVLGNQYLDLKIDSDIFEKEIVSARTFCLQEEAEALKKNGLGQGANYDNTLVVSKDGIVKNKLRFNDEFVRHKIADLMGDLYLLGMPVKGHIIAVKSGHSLNVRLVQKIKDQLDRQMTSAIQAVSGIAAGQDVDISTIMKILPHRYPFLLVDRVLSVEEGKRAVGIKNVTINENFFQGHFPGKPVMPGVLIIEAMAQVGGVLMLSPAQNRGKLAFFMAANNVKFRKPVVPGDQLKIEVEVGKIRSRTGQVFTRALVDGEVVAEAELMFALVEN